MNFVQHLEECLRDLAAEARKKHPGVKEASERATLKLRTLQSSYVAAVRKASNNTSKQQQAQQHPTTSIFQSSEILHPFLLAANYPNADYKLLEISFKAIRLLMEADAIVPSDGIHIVRVYQIQAQVVTAYFSKYYAKEIAAAEAEAQAMAAAAAASQHNHHQRNRTETKDSDTDTKTTTNDEEDDDENDFDDGSASTQRSQTNTSSSWFSWGSSSTSNTHDSSTTKRGQSSITIIKNAVSSSSGQAGNQASAQSYPQMEKLALEILSSLLQLVQLLKSYPEALTEEMWTHSVSLTCLWYSLLPTHTTSRTSTVPQSNTVQQAAHTTIHQLIGVLFQTNTISPTISKSSIRHKFIHRTWEDLLSLTASDSTRRWSTSSEATIRLNGAFQLCQKRAATTSANSTHRVTTTNSGSAALPPSPELSLALMTQVWKSTSFMIQNSSYDPYYEELLLKTMGVTMAQLHRVSHQQTSVEKALRTIQWTLALVQSHSHFYPNECRELVMYMVNKQIPIATTACRKHHDFEDGYVYSFDEAMKLRNELDGALDFGDISTSPKAEATKSRHVQLSLNSCFPLQLLYKAGFVLEFTYHILDKDNLSLKDDPELALLFTMDEEEILRLRGHSSRKTTLQSLTEVLSDFATVGSSCQDHVLQVVDFCYTRSESSFKPKLFRIAEQIIASGNSTLTTTALLNDGGHGTASMNVDTTIKGSHHNKRPSSVSSTVPSCPVLGESIWIAVQIILRINECLSYNCDAIKDADFLLKEIFPSSISVFQHFMKRFVASEELIRLTLKGYATLANITLQLARKSVSKDRNDDIAVQKRVLVTSLSKLALPRWGMNDHSSQLHDHHVMSLLCLLKIVHLHYDEIGAEYEIILKTFEELSMMPISSHYLSDKVYHASFALAAAYSRFAGLSTCLSNQSLEHMTIALIDICESALQDRDVVGDADTVLPDRSSSTTFSSDVSDRGNTDTKDPSTLGGKIMSIGVRAIYGNTASSSDSAEKQSDIPKPERTKNVYYQDYRNDFIQRISLSKCPVRINSFGRIPFSLILLTDIAMANLFRHKECGEMIASQFARLSASRPIIRPFLMDVMTMQIMAQLSKNSEYSSSVKGKGKIVFDDPMYSQLLAVENEDISSTSQINDASQLEVLGPLCESIKSTNNVGVARSSLNVLSSVLEGTGESLEGDVWTLVIAAISSVSGGSEGHPERKSAEWSACCLVAFKVLKLIVDDFMDQISRSSSSPTVSAHRSLLDCCSSFVVSRQDINTSLTAIGLLWTIADQDSESSSIDLALLKLVSLSSDDRTEVRNAAVNTLFSCIVGRGASFSPEFWKKCITDTILKVYDVVTEKSRVGDVLSIEDVAGKSTSSRYKVNLHHSRDSAGKQWIVTQVLVLRGLTRVLRNFFVDLLDSLASNKEDTGADLWFQDAWVRILDYAFDAAGQGGGRENLDIRSIGVELLVICCQLASKAGIQAAVSPAKVSTKMEVVNGALRNVREVQTSKVPLERTFSSSGESWREKLFLEAFESLECFDDEILKNLAKPDDIDLQVLHKYCSNLSKLYDCCKTTEFKVDSTSQALALLKNEENTDERSRGNLEGRYVLLIVSVLRISSFDVKTRFLNQCQRVAIDTLQTMAANGSPYAFYQLTSAAGPAFFVRKEGEESESGETDLSDVPTFLSFEVATAVSQEIAKESVSDECKMLVLYQVLQSFVAVFHVNESTKSGLRRRRYYKNCLPIIYNGLRGAFNFDLSSANSGNKEENVYLLWDLFCVCLKDMMAPIPVGKDKLKIPRVQEIQAIVKFAAACVPANHRIQLASTLAYGTTVSYDVAKQHAIQAQLDPLSDLGRKSKRHRDDLIKLFSDCFDVACSLNPNDADLQLSTKAVLAGAVEEVDEAASNVSIEASLFVCQDLVLHKGVENIIVGVFPLLCSILALDDKNKDVKDAAQKLLAHTDVAGTIRRSQARYVEAEKRAEIAEKRIAELEIAVEELQREKDMLQQRLLGSDS